MAKRPRDLNQMAKLVVDIASGEIEDVVSPKMRSRESVKGRAGGIKGGLARNASLSAEERSKIAKKAANARWQGSSEIK